MNLENSKAAVLLVDDDVNILHGYLRAFHKYDFKLYTAQSAEEAYEALKRIKIDVVVSDECMKGERGTELLAWVAEYFPDTVRIILTGQPSVPSMTSAINESAVFKYLLKPVDPAELSEVIQKGLNQTSNFNQV